VTATRIQIRSFAKINLALAVLGKRPDGYHNIQTVFQSISLYDTLELRISNRLDLECRNLPGVVRENNLVWKAAKLLSDAFPGHESAAIILDKRIPLGAGLGGGSSNAAATLLGLRALWRIDCPESDLLDIASGLGSDVPFFIRGGTALGSGRGEIIRPLEDFETEYLVVIYPGIEVSTAEAYRSLNLGLTSATEDNRIYSFRGQMRQGRNFLTGIFNDFEASIFSAHPVIGEAVEFLRQRGAEATLLSGSGSAVFGFFPSEESALAASRAPARDTWRVFPAKTLSQAEYLQSMFG
jgi:4-diphosphocytidyl-2-C-methyl-D-erythritol kinase